MRARELFAAGSTRAPAIRGMYSPRRRPPRALQYNRALKRVRLQISYMHGRNALVFLEMYIRRAMEKRIARLQLESVGAASA